jgi:molybdate transport system substrate-binding protein
LIKQTSLIVLSAALSVGLVAGCGSTSKSSSKSTSAAQSGTSKKTLVVFAASSLTGTFTQLGKDFEASHPGVTVKFSFAGSDVLASQIVAGAPADVFAAASDKTMKTAAADAGKPTVFVKNELEIAVPKSNPAKISKLADLGNKKNKVILCAPAVPCGAAAIKALAAAHVKVTPVSQETDVKAALTKIELNEADAALVYRTDVKSAMGKVLGINFPEATSAINSYPIATLTHAPQPALASQFVALVLSSTGSQVLTQAGFDKP